MSWACMCRFLFKAAPACRVSRFAILSALAPFAGIGATVTWTATGASNLWSDAANWSAGVPTNGDTLVFSATARTSPVDDILSLTIGTLTFAVGAPAFQLTVSGGAGEKTLTVGGAGFVNQSGETQR